MNSKERLQKGRTVQELHKYVDDLYPTIFSSEEKNKVVEAATKSECSFTRLEELIFEYYH
jgi:hypothetical protein